jgi:SpoOM protein
MVWTSLIDQGKRRSWMSLFLATLVALVFYHVARFYQGSISTWVLVLLGIPVALNLLRAALGLVYRLDRHPFHVLDLGLVRDQVAPGQSLEIDLVLEARRKATLTRLSAELRAVRQRNAPAGRTVEDLHSDAKSLEEGLALEPGLRKSYRVAFDLPAAAPYSFRSMEGKIVWLVRVEAEVEGWGELRDEIEITVAPA